MARYSPTHRLKGVKGVGPHILALPIQFAAVSSGAWPER
jgi:hypothetical protein